THVGIDRFTAGYREEGGAENGEADVEVPVDQEIEGVNRTDCGEHARRLHDAVDAEQGDHHKPGQHHRPEDIADKARAFFLNDEEPDQDDDRQWHYGGRQRRRIDLQALDRAQNRDRRRDGAVAVEQRRADQTDDQQLRTPRSRLGVAGGKQRQQGNDAAFAAVVGTQDQQRIFARNDQDQRPED